MVKPQFVAMGCRIGQARLALFMKDGYHVRERAFSVDVQMKFSLHNREQ